MGIELQLPDITSEPLSADPDVSSTGPSQPYCCPPRLGRLRFLVELISTRKKVRHNGKEDRVTTPEPAPVNAIGESRAMSTRDRLLHAVIEIAGREGHHIVTYRSVAARAAVTHGLVRHYFGTRDAMLAEAMQLATQQNIDTVALASDSIDEFAQGAMEVLEADTPRQILQYDLTLNAIRGISDKKFVVDIYDHYIHEVAQTHRKVGIDDPNNEWATVLLAALDGLILQHALYESSDRTEALLGRLRDVLRLLADRSSPGGTCLNLPAE